MTSLFDRNKRPHPDYYWDHQMAMWRKPPNLRTNAGFKTPCCQGCGAPLKALVCDYCKRTSE